MPFKKSEEARLETTGSARLTSRSQPLTQRRERETTESNITETAPCATGNFRKWLLYKCFMSLSLIIIQTNIKFLKITVTWINIW